MEYVKRRGCQNGLQIMMLDIISLIDKKMNRTELKDAAGISFNVLAKTSKNEYASMESL